MESSLVNFVSEKLDDLKAKDILHLNVSGKSPITEDLIFCTGTSSRHVSSMANNLIQECKTAGIETFGDEGLQTADWVVVDLGQVMVHIMQQESREFYELERLWS